MHRETVRWSVRKEKEVEKTSKIFTVTLLHPRKGWLTWPIMKSMTIIKIFEDIEDYKMEDGEEFPEIN